MSKEAEKQEPVGQLLEGTLGRGQVMWLKKPRDSSMLYTHPQPKQLVGLTPEELSAIWDSMGTWNSTSAQHFYNAIWKAIKEKNT